MEPDLVRVSILSRVAQLDAGLPVHAPIAALMPDLLAALRISDDSDAATWALSRVDGTRLAPSETLAQAAVLDGDLLLIRAARSGSHSPLVDDVADGVATALRRDREGWSADSSRWIGYAILLLGLLAAVPAGLLAADTDRVPVLTVSAVGSVLLLTIALAGRRLRIDARTAGAASIGACILAALAAAVVVPDVGGPARSAVAATAAGTVAVIGLRTAGRALAVHVAIATLAALSALAGTLAALWSRPVADIAAVVAVLAVGTVLLAPRLSIAFGRLPLPAVPTIAPDLTADSEPFPVDGVDALRLTDRDPLGTIADLALGDMQSLARRAATASSVLTGLLAGAVVAAGTATTVLAATGDPSTTVLLLGTCVVGGLAARGRTHADRTQSAILVAGSAVAGIAATLALLLNAGGPSPFTVFLVVLGIGGGALLLGTVAADGDYSPPAVRAAEILEYSVLIALLPLLLWVLDVYRAVRQL
ncbi:hypothetical protein ACH46_06080 [Gordonia phthalatica]|uniref:EccD-like transmembrane domain-containing protein n=2 Tax=Gordonia phthalatica TaxID=1136941 RepID=A0A0N9NEX5_9ACTN|nr:hypothetical protein ACH46_06080 [Gordonia phthalatica]